MSKKIDLGASSNNVAINKALPDDSTVFILDYTNISDGSTSTGETSNFSGAGNWTTLVVDQNEAPQNPGQYTTVVHDTIVGAAKWSTVSGDWNQPNRTWNGARGSVKSEMFSNEFLVVTRPRTEALYITENENNRSDQYISEAEGNTSTAYESADETNTGTQYVSENEENNSQQYISNSEDANIKTNR